MRNYSGSFGKEKQKSTKEIKEKKEVKERKLQEGAGES
jgi:hypothetical protein